MKDLNFDIYAMVEPKTGADVLALLDEALAELDNINLLLDKLIQNCERRNQ